MTEKHSPQFVELSPREAELSSLFSGRDETVKIAPEGWTYLKAMKKHINDYKNFEFEDSDVVINTFPKTGTTWVQELVWTMRNNPDLENPMANVPMFIRSPNLGDEAIVDHLMEKEPQEKEKFCAIFPDYDGSSGMLLYTAKVSPQPRTLKSHLPFSLLSPTILEKGKVVYVIRDPRDVCISYHHHCRLFVYEKYQGTFDQFIDAFIESAVLMGPYWAHVEQAWLLRDHPNMHIIFYEKIKSNPEEEMSKLNKFLGTELTEIQMEKILHFTSFKEMKKRGYHAETLESPDRHLDMAVVEKDGGFFRKGEAGGWRKVLTKEQKAKFEDWIEKSCQHKEILYYILNA